MAAPDCSIRKWASRGVGSTASRVELAARQLEHAPALVIAHAVPLAGAASDDDAVDTFGDEAPEKRAEAVLVDVAVLADRGNRNDEHAPPIGSALVHLKGPGDAAFRAVPRGEVREGDDIKIMVRPETIRLLGDGEQMANVVTATLRDIILVGQVTKFYAEISDGTQISATRLTHVGSPTAEPGSEIRFGWAEESTVLLPKSGGQGGA